MYITVNLDNVNSSFSRRFCCDNSAEVPLNLLIPHLDHKAEAAMKLSTVAAKESWTLS